MKFKWHDPFRLSAEKYTALDAKRLDKWCKGGTGRVIWMAQYTGITRPALYRLRKGEVPLDPKRLDKLRNAIDFYETNYKD